MSEKCRLNLELSQAEETVASLKSRIADLGRLVQFEDLKPGQKFKCNYPGANTIYMKCYTAPGTNITEYTPDFLGWAVNLSNGDLNEWEKSYVISPVD